MAATTSVYEGMFILDANRLARDREALPRELKEIIEAGGGQLELSRLWEERRLAYPIKGQRKGAYWITYFRSPTSSIKEMNRQLEMKDGILRHLFIRLPDALVEPILDHAKGAAARPASDAAESSNGQEVKKSAKAAEPVEATAS